MNVYILTREPFPIGMAATNRIKNYAKGLICNGINCKVIVTHRTEPHSANRNIEACGIADDIIPFSYIPHTPRRSSRFLMRRIDDFVDGLQITKWVRKNIHKGDVIIYFEPRFSHTISIINQCHRNGGKIVRELCEYPFATRNDSPKTRVKRWLYTNLYMSRFDGFIAISQALEQYANMVKSIKASIIKVPILVEANQYEGIERYTHKKPYIFHAGTMYERKDAIVSTMKAFALASKEIGYSVDFILAGPESPHKQELDQIIADSNLTDNVHFIGSLTHEEVLRYQKGAWLTILNKHDNVQNRNGFSTKLGDVLLAGTPVITTTVGEANNWLKDGESALITEPHNIEAIAAQIIRAYNEPELLNKIAVECQNVAKENFDYRTQGKRLQEYFEHI
ncbi:MAG: glycosyltransferase family 4 protein [Tidjanibacter sp.]|nr:glycosyltransferase family 4 protein [Tidjanibacter sp.]